MKKNLLKNRAFRGLLGLLALTGPPAWAQLGAGGTLPGQLQPLPSQEIPGGIGVGPSTGLGTAPSGSLAAPGNTQLRQPDGDLEHRDRQSGQQLLDV
jgi:hypothetical protein